MRQITRLKQYVKPFHLTIGWYRGLARSNSRIKRALSLIILGVIAFLSVLGIYQILDPSSLKNWISLKLTLNNMFSQGNQYADSLLLNLTDETEAYVQANVTCSVPPGENQASILAYANFDLELLDQTDSGRFTSTVVVASVPNSQNTDSPLQANLMVLGIIVAIFTIVGLVLYRVHKLVEEERRGELEKFLK